MLEDESFSEFYIKITNFTNSMINLGKKFSNAKLIKRFLDLCLKSSELR
jgi:hypothetical protein